MAKDWLTDHPNTISPRLVLIGGSAGSIDVLLDVLPALSAPLPYALLIIVHRKNTADSTLAALFSLRSGVPFKEVDDKDPIEPGTLYLAPADYHVLIERDGTFSLDASEKVNYSRPSIDVTFESAADVYGPALAGIVISGANADGTQGLTAIQRAGGTVAVQDPDTAQVAFMPQHARQHVPVELTLTVPELIRFLNDVGA